MPLSFGQRFFPLNFSSQEISLLREIYFLCRNRQRRWEALIFVCAQTLAEMTMLVTAARGHSAGLASFEKKPLNGRKWPPAFVKVIIHTFDDKGIRAFINRETFLFWFVCQRSLLRKRLD